MSDSFDVQCKQTLSCLSLTNVCVSEPPRGLSSKTLSLCNQQTALTSRLSSEQPVIFRALISTGIFWQQMFPSTPPIIRGARATEGPPIKTPSGPCWPPDEHMPRMHHVGAVQSHLTLPPVCHFTPPSARVLLALHHRGRQSEVFSGLSFFSFFFFFRVCHDKPT